MSIIDRIKDSIVPINPDIVEGIPAIMLKDIEEYTSIVFKSICDSGPEGLEFLGMEMARPVEAYVERCKVKSGRVKNIRDSKESSIAPSKGFPIEEKYFYMVKIYISWMGEKIEFKLFLPFTENGLIKINGPTFSFSPVLADKNISVTRSSVFVPLELREKLTFRSTTHILYKNGNKYTSTIARERIYRGSKDNKSSLRQILPHFLFAKFGMITAFKRFLNTDIAVGMGDEICAEDYPKEEWDIYESIKEKPPRFAKPGVYIGTDLKVAIKRKDITKPFLLNQMIGAVYYLADRFPEKIDIQYLDNVQLWRQIFAFIIKDKNSMLDVMLEQADRNIRSIDTYLDPITKNSFKQNGVDVEDFYDLLAYIGETFVPSMRDASNKIDYYDKKLILHRYICDPLICRVNNFVYGISRYIANKPGKEIPTKSIKLQLATSIFPTVLESINNNNSCTNAFSTSSDNYLFDLSTLVIPQNDYNRMNKKNAGSPLEDPSKALSASMAEVLSPLGATKNEPSGTIRLNPFVQIDKSKGFTIEKRSELAETVNRIEDAIG